MNVSAACRSGINSGQWAVGSRQHLHPTTTDLPLPTLPSAHCPLVLPAAYCQLPTRLLQSPHDAADARVACAAFGVSDDGLESWGMAPTLIGRSEEHTSEL